MESTVRRMLFLLLVTAGALLCPGLAHAEDGQAQVRRYALIIANNQSPEEGVPALSYADDDGAKYFELFRSAGAEVKLLTVLDPMAQRRYGEAARNAVAPSHAELSQALAGFFRQMREDRKAGRETHFFFVYAGHGSLGPNHEGYVNLVDGPFRRSDLYRDVLAASPATFNHVILDACQAYFMVRKRGTDPEKVGDFRATVRDFLGAEELEHYPNTGVIFASSSEAETQEWSRWESGLFSHELRSALLGGGDVDGDGNITYAEAAAFVEAANSAVDIPRARLRVFYRPPPLRAEVALLPMRAFGATPLLVVDAEHAGKYHVEDSRGVRVADLHSSPDHEVSLALVGTAPFFLRDADREALVPTQARTEVRELGFAPSSDRARGGVEATFRKHLFEVAFGPGFFQGMTAAGSDPESARTNVHAPLDREVSHPLRPWARTTLSAGVASGVAGGVMYALAAKAHTDYDRASTPEEARSLHRTSDDRLGAARVLFGVAGLMAATSVTLFVLDHRQATDAQNRSAHVSAALTMSPGTSAVVISGRW